MSSPRNRAALVAAITTLALVLGPGALAIAPVPEAQGGSRAAATVTAAAKKFKNCAVLHKKYNGGVAKNKKVKNTKVVRGKKVPATSKYRPTVSKKIYAKNKHLDRDKDGIACER
ncbi:MAG: excalibur calcium-binding domain-containing protein [Actinomycetota bacterium]|nr:excalibur calcium-binding domain-containing protein [Actinomycetota bacterium]